MVGLIACFFVMAVLASETIGWNLSDRFFSASRPDQHCNEGQQTPKLFPVIEKVIDSSDLSHLVVLTNSEENVLCDGLKCIQVLYKVILCSKWTVLREDFLIYLGNKMMANILVDCDNSTTNDIISYLLDTRGNKRRKTSLISPFYNIIITGHVQLRTAITRSEYLQGSKIVAIKSHLSGTKACHKRKGLPSIDHTIYELSGRGRWYNVGVFNHSGYTGKLHILSDRVDNLKGIHLNIATELYTPFVIRAESPANFSGYCIKFLDMLAEQLNFSYDLRRSVDKKFGVKKSNGEWNGLIGMMVRQEVDMVATGLTITSQREEAVDFTIPVWEEMSAVVISHDQYNSTNINWAYIFSPLELQLWICILALLVGFAVLHFIIDIISHHIISAGPMKAPFSTTDNLTRNIWFIVEVGLKQGFERLPSSRVSKFTTSFLWFAMIIITAIYCANLTANLSTTTVAPPIRTLKELADTSSYIILLNGGSAQRQLLEESKSGVFADMWRNIQSTIETSLTRSTKTSLKKLFNESDSAEYAVMSDFTSIQTKLARDYSDRCNWAFIPETFFKSGFGFALPEGSPFKEIFDIEVLRVWQTGMTLVWEEKFFYRTFCGVTSQSVNAEAKPVNVDDIMAIVVISSFMIGLALLSFFVEHCLVKGRAVLSSHSSSQ